MKNSFSWGNYDYQNLSDDLVKKINKSNNSNSNNNFDNNNDINNNNSNSPKIKQKILNPIKSKFNEGVEKIQSTKIYSTISSKFAKTPIHSENPSGIVINKENSYDIISKIREKEKYMKELQNKEESDFLMSNDYTEHDKETGLPIVSEFQLNCVIDDYKDKVVGKEHVVFYKIEIFSSLSGKKWDLYRSFSEFHDLYLVYKKFFLNVPEINFDKFSPKIVNQPLIHREFISKLNLFINNIIKKPALITSCYIIKFLQLQNHFEDISIYKPLLLYDSNDDRMNESVLNQNKFSVNAIYYLYDAKLLFIGTGNIEESMYNSMMKKINKLFKSQDPTFGTYGKENPNNICKGQFIIYNIINNNSGEIMFVELKCIDVISEITKFDYWFEKNYITLCLKNGQILIFKIFINEPSTTTREIVEYIGTINDNYSLSLCCIINFKCGYTYSFGQYENSVKIFDLNYQNLVKEVNILNKKSKGFICVDYTISLECIYVQDDDGSIYFIDIMSDYLKPCIIQEFKKFLPCDNNSLGEKDKGKIIQINNSYYLLIGGINKTNKKKECILSIYLIQIDYNDNINLIKLREIYLGGNISITDVNINNKEDLIIAISNGSICIYNKCYNYPEYIIDAHLKKISGFIWIEKQKMIITASHDKSIKVYQFPLKWPAEFLRINKQINDLSIINEINGETKTLYDELYSSNYNNYNDNNYNNKNYGNIWDIGNKKQDNIKENPIIKDFWKYKNNENKKIKEDEKDEDKNIIEEDEEEDINENFNYPKPEKYDKINTIFCDDLDGWSIPKKLNLLE